MDGTLCKMARTLCVLLVAVAAAAESQEQWRAIDLNEGSSCTMMNGGQGVCRLLSQCPDQLAMLHGSGRHKPRICSFQQMAAVVCCSEEHGNTSPSLQKSHPTSGRNYWDLQPNARAPSHANLAALSSAPPSSAPPTATEATQTPSSKATQGATRGDKSNKACREYSKEVSRFVFPLIYLGDGTHPGDFPHMALLGYQSMGQNKISWNCGGALISRRFVVTAAHCFSDKIWKTPVRVRLGEYDLLDDNDHAVDYVIKRWVVHPEYRARSWYHDLALIELDRDVKFSWYIQPACLWTRPQDPPTGLIITGWGSTQQDGGPMSTTLLKGNGTLNRVEPNVCMEFYKAATLQLRNGIQEGILCATDPMGSVDSCEGDSGGPIQLPSAEGVSYYVVGVVSGGSRWCGSRVPSVYTRLYTYLDWIERVVWPDD